MAPANKKAIVRMLDGQHHSGYLPGGGLREADGTIALLTLEARILPLLMSEILHVAFVRDFNVADPADPERLYRRTFLARPRSEGLWLRLTLLAGEPLEGLAPLDLTLADSLINDAGIYLVPPDNRSNTQRLFLPRTAITAMQVVAVITTPTRPKAAPSTASGDDAQPSLFS